MDYSDGNSSESSVDSATKHLRECLKQFNEDNGSQYYLCKICNFTVFIGSVVSHVESYRHRNGVDQLLETHEIVYMCSNIYYCNLCYSYTDDFMAHIENNVDHINWRWICGDVDKDELKFYIYEQYDNSKKADEYKSIYDTMLSRNYIEKYNDETFFCVPCDLRLNRVCEIDHMFGRRHATGLEDYQYDRKV